MTNAKQILTEKLEQVAGKDFVKNKVIIMGFNEEPKADQYDKLEWIKKVQKRGVRKIINETRWTIAKSRLAPVFRDVDFMYPGDNEPDSAMHDFTFCGEELHNPAYTEERAQSVAAAIKDGRTHCCICVSVGLKENDPEYHSMSDIMAIDHMDFFELDLVTGKEL